MISPRLKEMLEAVGQCRVLADIGTDHAYLPIEAIRAGFCETAIACDIVHGPLKMAEFNIRAAGFAGRIETRLGDGLQPLAPNEADCITIAGMGGKNIMHILSAAPQTAENARLILQPQHDLEDLRRFLHANSYNILEEKLVHEKSKKQSRFYVILIASYTTDLITPWTDADYFLGQINSPHLHEYLREKHRKISGYINSVSDISAQKLAQQRLEWIYEKLEDLGVPPQTPQTF